MRSSARETGIAARYGACSSSRRRRKAGRCIRLVSCSTEHHIGARNSVWFGWHSTAVVSGQRLRSLFSNEAIAVTPTPSVAMAATVRHFGGNGR